MTMITYVLLKNVGGEVEKKLSKKKHQNTNLNINKPSIKTQGRIQSPEPGGRAKLFKTYFFYVFL